MIFEDFHIHSKYSDGNASVEEIVETAIKMGMKRVGISDHSYTEFDKSYCIKKEEISNYKNEILSLNQRYGDKIKVLCGIEQDYYSNESTNNFDYVIGSVHYLKINDDYIPVDESPEILINASNKYFNGDIYKLIDLYCETVADVVNRTNADIIGHFDLITKFNENNQLFDMSSERYFKVAKKAIDKLLLSSKPFEINTGAISRGYRTTPYPDDILIKYIIENGGKLILSSDSHNKNTIMFNFNECYAKYKDYIIKFQK